MSERVEQQVAEQAFAEVIRRLTHWGKNDPARTEFAFFVLGRYLRTLGVQAADIDGCTPASPGDSFSST